MSTHGSPSLPPSNITLPIITTSSDSRSGSGRKPLWLSSCGLRQRTARPTNDTMSTTAAAHAKSHSGIGRSARPLSPWAAAGSGATKEPTSTAAEMAATLATRVTACPSARPSAADSPSSFLRYGSRAGRGPRVPPRRPLRSRLVLLEFSPAFTQRSRNLTRGSRDPRPLPPGHGEVERGQHEQVQQRRGYEAAEDRDCERVLDLVPGNRACEDERHESQSRRRRGHQDRREPVLRALKDERGAERDALLPFEMPEVGDHEDAVPSRNSEHGQQSDHRAERELAGAQLRGHERARESHREEQEDERSQPEASEAGLEEEEDDDRREDAEERQVVLGGVQLGRFTEDLRVVAGREVDLGQMLLDLIDRRGEVTPGHVGRGVESPRLLLPLDRVRNRPDPNVRDLFQRHRSTVRRVDREVLDVADAVAGRRDRPHVHVVRLTAVEEVADLLARDQRRGVAPDQAGRDPVSPRRLGLDLDLNLRNLLDLLHLRVDDAVDRAHPSDDLFRLLLQDVDVRTEGAHDDGFVCSAQHLLHALA